MKKGFTLIELLVVIAIIGILASIVLVSLNNARQKARDVNRVGDVRQVQLALEGYYDDNQAYPGGDEATPGVTTCQDLSDISSDLVPDYIAALPVDPGANQDSYAYDAPDTADGQNYVLRADLEDTGHSALSADVDGVAADNYGCDCEDATNGYFCARP